LRSLRQGVLEEDAAVRIARLAERAADDAAEPRGRDLMPRRVASGTARTVLAPALDTAGDWLPGLRDEHAESDDAASDPEQPRGTDSVLSRRRTWDPSVTPNVIKRRGERPRRRG
ncbi:MAG: hypothetical protein ACKN9G_04755, partial [Candidatus Limnocylindrus sp.]